MNIDEIVESCSTLIYSIIEKYVGFFDRDDLFQVGVIGVLIAYKNYKKNRNIKFSSYAYFYILGEVTKYIRDNNSIKQSRDVIAVKKKIRYARGLLEQVLFRNPTDQELAEYLGIDEKDISEVMQVSSIVESLDKDDEETRAMYDMIGYDEQSYREDYLDLKNEVAKLRPLNRNIINARYTVGLSQSETSKYLGVSQSTVSREEEKALSYLRIRLYDKNVS